MLTAQYQLFKHQKEAVELFKKNKGILGLFAKQGTGKCLMSLACYDFLKTQLPSLKLVVVCPLSLIIYDSWKDDVAKFSDYTVQDLHKNIDKIDTSVDIYLINYEMFRGASPIEALQKKMALIRSKLRSGRITPEQSKVELQKLNDRMPQAMIAEKKTKFAIIKRLLDWKECMLVLDESSFLKSHDAITTKRILSISHLSKYKMCLSGTPCPNTEMELWPQITFLKDGVFHAKFFVFKNQYFHLQRGAQVMEGGVYSKQAAVKAYQQGFKYSITERKREELLALIKPFCMFKKKSDCSDLTFTDQTFIPKLINMDKKQDAIYREMKTNLIVEINRDWIVANMALKKILKLRQITSGILIGEETHRLEQNAKLEALRYDTSRFGSEQIIIWGFFTEEIALIKELLGDRAGVVNGQVSVKEKQQAISDFKTGHLQYLIANPASISHGLTFLNCHYQIYFSISDSFEKVDQSKDRIHRIGQEHDCVYYYYLCKDTIDEIIYNNVQNKQGIENLVHEFLNG